MNLLKTFDFKNYNINSPVFIRYAARAIIFKNGKIALVKSHKNQYYKFPGGGKNKDEDIISTLIRETKEETGLIIENSSIKELGYTKEIRNSTYKNQIFKQYSYYYFAKVKDEITCQQLDDYESFEGFKLEYVDIQTAINANKIACLEKNSFLLRENYILSLILKKQLVKKFDR